ncbi:hypothetical protein PINS_up013567 [Pythium insidiosum]|nr:hypothetical protein PINS_up013567 [Pythium insidiosum]
MTRVSHPVGHGRLCQSMAVCCYIDPLVPFVVAFAQATRAKWISTLCVQLSRCVIQQRKKHCLINLEDIHGSKSSVEASSGPENTSTADIVHGKLSQPGFLTNFTFLHRSTPASLNGS